MDRLRSGRIHNRSPNVKQEIFRENSPGNWGLALETRPISVDPVLGAFTPNLDKLVVMGNSATVSAIFDDFYLSTGGYNATVPKPYGVAVQPGPLSVSRVGNQLQIVWTGGTLQSSANVTGPYVDVPANPTSPYLVAPAGERSFYRTRQ